MITRPSIKYINDPSERALSEADYYILSKPADDKKGQAIDASKPLWQWEVYKNGSALTPELLETFLPGMDLSSVTTDTISIAERDKIEKLLTDYHHTAPNVRVVLRKLDEFNNIIDIPYVTLDQLKKVIHSATDSIKDKKDSSFVYSFLSHFTDGNAKEAPMPEQKLIARLDVPTFLPIERKERALPDSPSSHEFKLLKKVSTDMARIAASKEVVALLKYCASMASNYMWFQEAVDIFFANDKDDMGALKVRMKALSGGFFQWLPRLKESIKSLREHATKNRETSAEFAELEKIYLAAEKMIQVKSKAADNQVRTKSLLAPCYELKLSGKTDVEKDFVKLLLSKQSMVLNKKPEKITQEFILDYLYLMLNNGQSYVIKMRLNQKTTEHAESVIEKISNLIKIIGETNDPLECQRLFDSLWVNTRFKYRHIAFLKFVEDPSYFKDAFDGLISDPRMIMPTAEFSDSYIPAQHVGDDKSAYPDKSFSGLPTQEIPNSTLILTMHHFVMNGFRFLSDYEDASLIQRLLRDSDRSKEMKVYANEFVTLRDVILQPFSGH